MKAVRTAVIALIAVAGCKPNAPPPPAHPEPFTSGDELISAMQDRYAGRWYRTATFVQTSTTIAPDGKASTAIWYEALLLPSRLRVDFDPLEAGNGALIHADTQFVIQRGSVIRTVPRTNELLLLGFDVYFLDPAATSAWLRRIGFDMSRIRQDVWEGREVYVVGARSPSDLRSRQFWVDRQNMLFMRMISPAQDSTKTEDVRFANYEKIGSAWIAPRVEVYEDGRLTFKEDYQHIRINVGLDTALFDPAQWRSARHWYLAR